MKTVHEVSDMAGVSVRTLHHYDAIGLLKPTRVSEAGYRLYDDTAIGRLQTILLFRELQFPLKEIKAILDSPAFDPSEALRQQIKLLELQQKHLEELIAYAREIQRNGVIEMNFSVFDKTELEQYAAEAKAKWGGTKAYMEYEEKQISGDKAERAAKGLMGIFADIGRLCQLPPESKEVQEKIGALQAFITENYYVCTKEMLLGLGAMYVSDERMRKNIDSAGGAGTAEFADKAIKAYCE